MICLAKKKIHIRGIEQHLLNSFTIVVKRIHGGKLKDGDGSFVAAEINRLLKLYILSDGVICHSELLASKKQVIKKTLNKLEAIQQQQDFDGFLTSDIKKIVMHTCVENDLIDPRTQDNYFNAIMQRISIHPHNSEINMFR